MVVVMMNDYSAETDQREWQRACDAYVGESRAVFEVMKRRR